MSKKVHDDPDLLSKGDTVDIYSIVISVALTDYRPVHWEQLKELIMQRENIAQTDKKEIIWIKFAASLCLLDIYKLEVFTKCLNETFLSHLFKKCNLPKAYFICQFAYLKQCYSRVY